MGVFFVYLLREKFSNNLITEVTHELNTDEGETRFKNHLKIDNTNLTPDEVVAFLLVCMLQV